MLLDVLACAGSLAVLGFAILAAADAYEHAEHPNGFFGRLRGFSREHADRLVVAGAVALAICCAASYAAAVYTFIRLVRAIITA